MNLRYSVITLILMLSLFSVDSNPVKADDDAVKSKKIFIVNGDGTITDSRNTLMWVQKPERSEYEWMNAINHVKSLNKANGGKGTYGYKDWRLPRIDELKLLIKDSADTPASWLNSNGFENIQPGGYWSSTTYNADTPSAWSIDLSNGTEYGCAMAMNYMVLPVRRIKK
jgi:hypothetical protein